MCGILNQCNLPQYLGVFMYPPRPVGKITPNLLAEYERTGRWVVQRKYNGTHILLNVLGTKVQIFDRMENIPKQFTLTESIKDQILSLNLDRGKEYWLDGEVLDAKTKNPLYKNRIVLYDLLQAGHYLFGAPTLLGRLSLLREICRNPKTLESGFGIALSVTENVWMAETFESNFLDRYNDFIDKDEIEGLVLKKSASVLDNIGSKEYEVGWLIRCRKSHKNYKF